MGFAHSSVPVAEWNDCDPVSGLCSWSFQVIKRIPYTCDLTDIPPGMNQRRFVRFFEDTAESVRVHIDSDFSSLTGDMSLMSNRLDLSGIHHDYNPADIFSLHSRANCNLDVGYGLRDPEDPSSGLWPVEIYGTCDWREPIIGSIDCRGVDTILIKRPGVSVKACTTINILAVEFTQAVQNWANTIPLVEDKETYVRVFPIIPPDGSCPNPSQVKLRINFDNGAESKSYTREARAIDEYSWRRNRTSQYFSADVKVPEELRKGKLTVSVGLVDQQLELQCGSIDCTYTKEFIKPLGKLFRFSAAKLSYVF